MKITFLGHAGLYIETQYGTVLCDPWFNPAFFASWFPFPANDHLDPAAISNPDFLYISHEHHDHFDPQFLTQYVSKNARVLLPNYRLKRLHAAIAACGFKYFVETTHNEPMQLEGLRVLIMALSSPSDGPAGDSALLLSDGKTTVFNQNDSHPTDFEHAKSFGPIDAHFLQFSGAIWYPFVYNFPAHILEELASKKRTNQQERACRFIKELNARHVFPCAGPPCFLDDDLFELNDFDNNSTHIFYDQTVFLQTMHLNGYRNGHLVIPGTSVELDDVSSSCVVAHPFPQSEVDSIFAHKHRYLEGYRARKRPLIQSIRMSWPKNEVEILPAIKDWFEPLLELADVTCSHINACVLLDCSPRAKIVIDFVDRQVRAWNGEPCPYRFFVDPSLVETCILKHYDDWVNELFLSCRFRAERDAPYNEYLYSFLKCLTAESLRYVEQYYTEQDQETGTFDSGGYRIQRYCPHRHADLVRFGKIENGILTCQMHGWQFDLATGKCLSANGPHIQVQPIEDSAKAVLLRNCNFPSVTKRP
jgi:UDP-MurNAc hydroxylase